MRRVAITGMGIVSPIGNDPETVRDALVAGRSGIRAMPDWACIDGLRSRVGGVVDGVEPRTIPRRYRRTMGRVAILGTVAALDAVRDAGLDSSALASERAGVAMGATLGSPGSLEQVFREFVLAKTIAGQEGTVFMRVMSHTVAANVAAVLGVRGRLVSPCTACSSSTQAIGAGHELIAEGRQDVMVCGGAEELHSFAAGVFDVLGAASTLYNDAPDRTPRPFDRDRDGLVVGEGAAALVLEDYERARARGARIHAEVLGYASCCGASHMALPSRDGMLQCMREAAHCAGIEPQEIDYINAHATGTEIGDAAEAEATREFAGDSVPVSATKGYTGHTLAACGAIEAIFCLLMMRDGFLAPSRNLDNVADDCKGLAHVQQLVEATPHVVLTSNFAFGGVMASLVFGKA